MYLICGQVVDGVRLSPSKSIEFTIMAPPHSAVVPVDSKNVADTDRSNESPPDSLRKRVTAQARPFGERRRSSILVGQRSLDLLAMDDPGQKGPKFVMFIIRQYKRWGYFIAKHDWKAMIVCLLISGLGLFKVLTTPQENDITGYSPYGARARDEYKTYNEFFSEDGLGITVYVFALAKDGGSMLRETHLEEVVNILDDALVNVTMFDRDRNSSVSFSEFCHSFCLINEPVRQFYNGFHIQKELMEKGQPLNGRLNLSYPISSIFGRSLTLQQNFYGIRYYNDHNNTLEDNFNVTAALLSKAIAAADTAIQDEDEEPGNSTMEESAGAQAHHITNMKSAKIVVLQFRAEHESGWTVEGVKKYEMDMVNHFQKNYNSELLTTYVFCKTYVEEEMVRAGLSLVPYLSMGFFVMSICSVTSVVARAFYMHQHSTPKIVLAIMACVLPFMSCATALGLMFTFGMRFASILCVIPFLVLSIGVDSSYLMIHEWQRVIKHCRDHPNRKNVDVGYRISEVLSEIGPAIMISTLTNVFADGVGAFTSSPEITLLCVGNLVSMVIAFIYQMTFYAGLMSLVGRYEVLSEKKDRAEYQASIRAAQLERIGNGVSKHKLTRQSTKFHDNTKHALSATMHRYVNFVSQKTVALTTVLIYFIYLAFSIYGISHMNINLTTQKLFTADSPLLALDKIRVQYQVPHFTMATVFVNRPGNLSDPARLKRMNQFVEDMEKIRGSWGPVGTQYFVRDFLTFESSFETSDSEPVDLDQEPSSNQTTALAVPQATPDGVFKEEDIRNFIDWPEYSYWGGFLKLNNETDRVEKFFFTTAYHGKELSIWTERGKMLNEWRRVVDQYSPEFNAAVFHEDGVFLDLIENMPTDTWQSVLGTLVCMAAVCFVFLNSLFTVVIASSCVLSICAGILGILSWWSIDLDPITMAAMVISIGFSVDIPHTCPTIITKLRFGSLTPLLKQNCLLFVHIYMSEVFVKTMVICVVLCNMHGLIFLPAFLILFDSAVQFFRKLSMRARRMRRKNDLDQQGDQLSSPSFKPNASPNPARNGKPGDKKHKLEEKQRPNFSYTSQDSAAGHIPQRHNLSRISSTTDNSNSTVCDRPELDFASDSEQTRAGSPVDTITLQETKPKQQAKQMLEAVEANHASVKQWLVYQKRMKKLSNKHQALPYQISTSITSPSTKIPPPPSEHPPPYTPFGGQAANDTLLPTAQPRSGQQAAAGQSNNRNSRVIQPRGIRKYLQYATKEIF
uniref:SSD domain-containing protein n=1 Tax=Ditylenchus dipsaci TaxID=166011 RepID=A0A915CR01_9BILA